MDPQIIMVFVDDVDWNAVCIEEYIAINKLEAIALFFHSFRKEKKMVKDSSNCQSQNVQCTQQRMHECPKNVVNAINVCGKEQKIEIQN